MFPAAVTGGDMVAHIRKTDPQRAWHGGSTVEPCGSGKCKMKA